MPTPQEILNGVGTLANRWVWLAIVWHIYFGAIVLGLITGFRPRTRIMGYLLALPLASVSAMAWVAGNPFNGIVFALVAITLALVSSSLPPDPVRISSPGTVIAGTALFIFGWLYPHFLDTTEFAPYLYSAPTGLIPCPTLSILIGATLILRGLGSRGWSLTLGTIGVFYGIYGVLRLRVMIDIVLLVGALILIWVMFVHRWEDRSVEEATATPATKPAAGISATVGSIMASELHTGARLLLLLGTLAILLGTFVLAVRPWYQSWGATDEEIGRSMPGDEIAPGATVQATRSITIDAGAERVWPWIAQLGQDRGGFYSFDLLENIAGCEMPGGDSLVPARQSWTIGDRLWMYPSDRMGGAGYAPLRRVIPGRALVFGMRAIGSSPDDPDDGSWTFVIEPRSDSSSRFIIRGRGASERSLLGVAFDRAIFEPVVFVMEKRTMIGIKEMAETGERSHLYNNSMVALWTVTFGFFIAAIVKLLRNARWARPLAGLIASAVVFQILTLGQPPLLIGVLLVLAVAAILWAHPEAVRQWEPWPDRVAAHY
jgi:hypothetical protein